MGLTTLPKVGPGENLGVVKQDKPLELIPENRKIKATEWNTNAAALEAVCAEVGLHDGSTPGSLVERVEALEDAPPGSGDVTGPASAVDDRIATFDGITGKLIQDGGVAIGAIAAAQADATQALADAATAQADATTALSGYSFTDVDLVSINTSISNTSLNKTFAFAVSGSDLEAQFSNSCTAGQVVRLHRTFTAAPDPGGALVLGSAGSHRFNGATTLRVTRAYATVTCTLLAIDGGVYYWTITGDTDESASDSPVVQTAHTSATRTLASTDAGDIIPLNAASNAIAVTIPHTLFGALGAGRAWSCGFYVTSVAGGAVTFAGSGGIVIKYFGKKPSASAIVAGDTIFATVVSATLAHVHISAEIP